MTYLNNIIWYERYKPHNGTIWRKVNSKSGDGKKRIEYRHILYILPLESNTRRFDVYESVVEDESENTNRNGKLERVKSITTSYFLNYETFTKSQLYNIIYLFIYYIIYIPSQLSSHNVYVYYYTRSAI